jgi:hypothetical protein
LELVVVQKIQPHELAQTQEDLNWEEAEVPQRWSQFLLAVAEMKPFFPQRAQLSTLLRSFVGLRARTFPKAVFQLPS